MPEPASPRSLEDILASIRKSLADETVDGLVELSAAAVDAARADASFLETKASRGGVSAADALADDLLRDKLAGALVLDAESGEGDVAARDQDEITEFHPGDAAELEAGAEDAGSVDGAALAKLWVLRPGLEQAKPTAATARPLTLDPFATSGLASGGAAAPADFTLSPRDLLGEAKALSMPLASMPPLPHAPANTDAAGAGPPRLDPDSIALLKKLRASNAAAIEKMAKANDEAEAEPEEIAAEMAPPISEDIVDAVSIPQSDAAPAAEQGETTTTGEEARPLLSLPERSTPLFGGHPDARPAVTSGLDHLLAEQPAAPLQVEEILAAETVEILEPAEPSLATEEEAASLVVADAAPETSLPEEPEVVVETLRESQIEAEPERPELVDVPVAVPEPEAMVAHAAEAQAEEPHAAPQPGGNKALEDMIAAVLEPVLQRLIETSIGPALEALVRREVERVLKEQQPPQ